MKKWTVAIIRLLIFVVTLALLSGGNLSPAVQTSLTGTVVKNAPVLSAGESSTPAENPGEIPGMTLIMQDGDLALFFNKTTTEIAVKSLPDGNLWYSNPPDRKNDTVAEAAIKAKMGMQLQFFYFNPTGSDGNMDNYTDSVAKGQFDFDISGGVLTVNYLIGDKSTSLAAPKRIQIARFDNELLPAIADEKERDTFKKSYRLVSEGGYYELWGNLTKNRREQVLAMLVAMGYTEKDLARDNQDNGIVVLPQATFGATIQYTLQNNALVVKVPFDKLVYSSSFPLNRISVLPYFGAAGVSDTGYILIPDGSGALINLNNNKTSTQPYFQQMYGRDNAVSERSRGAITESARIPVFGIKKDKAAMIAVIEQGDALSNVEADISGRTHSYNTVFSSYNTITRDKIILSGLWESSEKSIFSDRMPKGDIVINYMFLSGDQATYSGMASQYRNYLVSRYGMSQLPQAEKSPFFLELIGAIQKKATFIGIPYRQNVSLTNFSQAEEIVTMLKDAGIDQIKLRYTGWMNTGLQQKPAFSINPVGFLGGKSGLDKLIAFLKDEQVGFYPDISILHYYDNRLYFGRNPDASLFINQRSVDKYPYNLATGRPDRADTTNYFITSPVKVPSLVKSLVDAYARYNLASLSAGDLGDMVNSDFRKGEMVDRQESAEINKAQSAVLAGRFPDLMVSGGNAVLLPNFKSVVNAPLESSGFQIVDESIPFYEMVFHGYIDYAGKPVNIMMVNDFSDIKLKLLESGANIYFQWMYEPSSIVKDSEYDYLYASSYSDWLTTSIELYNELSGFLGKVRHMPITSHEKLAPGVFLTKYGDAYSVTVNYNDWPVSVQNMTIDAKGYKIGGDQP